MTDLSGSNAARIGERLVAAGLVTDGQVEAALASQRVVRGRLGHHLARLGAIAPAVLAEFLEREILEGRLEAIPEHPDPVALAAVPPRVAHLYNVYPLSLEDQVLQLAVPPTATTAVVEDVAAVLGLRVDPMVVPGPRLRKAIERDFLGGERPAVVHAASGLPLLVVDDELRGLRPLAGSLRTKDLSAEAWLRSLVAEAVATRQRSLEVTEAVGEGSGSVRLGGGDPVAVSPRLAQQLVELTCSLATISGQRGKEGGGSATLGAFQALVRGRRLRASVLARRSSEGAREVRISLGDRRLYRENADDLFEEDDVREAIEAFMGSSRGLLLACSPAGGGARSVVGALAARLLEMEPTALRIVDVAATSARTIAVAGDGEAARGLHRAAERGAALVVVDELPGPQSVERALLVAAQRRVVASLTAADAAGALAWLAAQGLGGALKTGLLAGVVSVLALEERCACAASARLGARVASAWSVGDASGLVANRGCPACFEAPVRRTWPVMAWTPVAGRPPEEFAVADEAATRAAAARAGRRSTLDLACDRVRAHRDGLPDLEIGAAVRLLAPTTA